MIADAYPQTPLEDVAFVVAFIAAFGVTHLVLALLTGGNRRG